MTYHESEYGALVERMRTMSAADLSILAASVEEPGSGMTTRPGSANELLWSMMAAFGWIERTEDPGPPLPLTIYTITPKGAEQIKAILARLAKE